MNNPTVKIENFDIDTELRCRCCGMYNYSDEFLVKLQAFRYGYGKPLTVTCGCRCKKHNADVGGVPTSLHECTTKKASAVDCYNKNLKKLYEDACKSGLFNEVIWYDGYKGMHFVHIGIDPNQTGNYFAVKN